jgi:hypothetical protein
MTADIPNHLPAVRLMSGTALANEKACYAYRALKIKFGTTEQPISDSLGRSGILVPIRLHSQE